MRLCILSLFSLLLFNCSEEIKKQEAESKQSDTASARIISDTSIGSKEITNEIAGANYRKRAKGYFVIANEDTSEFMPIFTESKEGGRIGMDMRFEKSMSYRQHYNELAKILPLAAKDFQLDSLRSVSMGRFTSSGDLAINVSSQFLANPDLNQKKMDYKKISTFLVDSKLGEDFNKLFNSYGIIVSGVSVEKVFLTDSKDVYNISKIETDSSQVPEQLLDCQTWIILNKK